MQYHYDCTYHTIIFKTILVATVINIPTQIKCAARRPVENLTYKLDLKYYSLYHIVTLLVHASAIKSLIFNDDGCLLDIYSITITFVLLCTIATLV